MKEKKRQNNFDAVAPVYDALARAVFGRSLETAQAHNLQYIRDGATVLILGGGTGWIAETLLAHKPHCAVWYVEDSAQMIARARSRRHMSAVHFIHGTERSLPAMTFDVVITNFYVDLFRTPDLSRIVLDIKKQLRREGIWLVTDFKDTGRRAHRWLLRAMYAFFRITSNIAASRLPAWQSIFERTGFVVKDQASFHHGFICSVVFHPR